MKKLGIANWLNNNRPELLVQKEFEPTSQPSSCHITYGNEYTAILYCGSNYKQVEKDDEPNGCNFYTDIDNCNHKKQ